MPQKIICKGCGQVLYEGEILKSPHDLIKNFEGHCPNCGRDLSFMKEAVEVKPYNS